VRLYNLPEGDYYVVIQGELANSYVSDVRIGTTSVYSDSIVTIGNGPMEDLQVVLRSNGGTIEGTVQNNLRAGVSGAEVRLVPDGLRRQNHLFYSSAETDASGAYRFAGVAPGDYKLFVFEVPPPGDATQNAEFIAQYEQRGVRVVVREGTSIPGVILPVFAK